MPTNNPSPSDGLNRQLPHHIDAERALLGSMLLEESAIGEAIAVLKEVGGDAFFFNKHRELYRHIVALFDQNRPIDGVVIRDELEKKQVFEQLGGYEFLVDLVNAVPSAQRVRHYAQIVKDKFLLRQLINAAHHIMDEAFRDARPTRAILDAAQQAIFEVAERSVSERAQPLPDLVQEVFRKLQDLDGKAVTGVPTGLYELDEQTCGLQPSELIVVAGRPSMGKTAFGLNIAEHVALHENLPVLFFSLEMSRQQLAQRILCSQARVDSHRMRRGALSQEELSRLHEAADRIRSRPFFIDDTSSLTILELRTRAWMEFHRQPFSVIFVDYLQLMHVPGEESRQAEVAAISRGLKALAKELKVPVVALAQLNRGPEDRSGNRPRMSDLRESGAIEQDADVVILLHRESYYKQSENQSEDEDTTAEVIIAKQRNGPVGTVSLHFNRRLTRFDNPFTGRGGG